MAANPLSDKVKERWKDGKYREKISAAFAKRRAEGRKPRDSSLEAEAAEREVVTRLCMQGLMAYQYPRNFHSVDVLAFHERLQRSPRIARISVKFRHQDSGAAFDISNFEGVDFVAVLRGSTEGFTDTWIIPGSVAKKLAARRAISRINFSRIDEKYRNAWGLIQHFCTRNPKAKKGTT